MSTVINTNITALNAHRNLKNVGESQEKASQKLSSGLRINSAADDAAGLAISEKMRGQIRGLDMASKNAQDGISMLQTAEGGLQEITNMTQRVRELTVQAANDSNTAEDRKKIGNEVTQVTQEITRMASTVEFNKKKLISGNYSAVGAALVLQVGANSSQTLSFTIGKMTATSLGIAGVGSTIANATTKATAISKQIDIVETALGKVTDERAKIGAIQNRLEYSIKNLDTSSENISAAESRIRDTDMAKEMMKFTKSNVLSQAATNMLSQANQAPNNVLSLLR